jgi:hypothetical protein
MKFEHKWFLVIGVIFFMLPLSTIVTKAASWEMSADVTDEANRQENISVDDEFAPVTAEMSVNMTSAVVSDAFTSEQIGHMRHGLSTFTPDADAHQACKQSLQAPTDPDPNLIGWGMNIVDLSWDGVNNPAFLRVAGSHGGTLSGVRIESPSALAMRVGLLVSHLPDSVIIAFFSANSDEPVASPVTGAEINRLLELNLSAGDHSDAGRTYWSPVVDGEEIILVVYVPEDVDPSEVIFSVPRISHIFQDPLSDSGGFNTAFSSCSSAFGASDEGNVLQSAAWCNLDISCYSSWSDKARAIAKMTYTKGNGNTAMCSGALLNDKDSSTYIPYFLTANHCISTQTVASSLVTHWFYQSASCNSSARNSRYQTLTGGAQLLYRAEATDTSFLRLNDNAPDNALFLGWTTADPSNNESLTGIHHPDGDYKKISFGSFAGYLDCGSTDSTGFSCRNTTANTGKYLNVAWQRGITEGGSSGSPIFNVAGQVIGQLRGGSSSCGGSGTSVYGRFDLAYTAALSRWLNDSSGPTIPSAPSNVSASDGTYSDKIRVTWSAATGATAYEVWRGTSSSSSSATRIAGDVTSTTYDDASAIRGTTYYYWVKAKNAAGTSGFSASNSGYRSSSSNDSAFTELAVNGATLTGNIATGGEVDWYQFRVTSSGNYTIETWAGTLSDNYMELYGPNSQNALLVSDDDSGVGLAAKITRSLAAGTYYVKVRAYSSTRTGTYSIKVTGGSGGGGGSSFTELTVNGATVTGDISTGGELDWYQFTVASAGTYTIETWAGTLSDNYMQLYGPNSQSVLLESDDDDGVGLAAKITRSLAVGTYYVKVRAYSSTSTGTYTIKVSR